MINTKVELTDTRYVNYELTNDNHAQGIIITGS